LAKTLNIAQQIGMSKFILPTLTDVDTAQDLEVWEKVKTQALASNQKISIIIPTLNEAVNLGRSLASITKAENIEVIIVDGGSSDQTIAIAQTYNKSMGVAIISGTLGRANQMNLGASLATGEILVFLHADTVLPSGFDRTIREILTNPRTIAGAFKLKIDGKSWGLRLVEWGVNRRSQVFQMPYGDQAIFIKSATFLSLGGFTQLPIMEDFDLILRLKKVGKIAIAPLTVTTSDRRWQKLGIFRTTLINQLIILGYFCGIKPTKLASCYHHWKSKN
jgi:rSAM/selenodomain-associated transferase 2